MHNYYAVIARAVARLGNNTPAERQVLFDRIRVVFIDQIRIRRPAATNSEIMQERAALEAAIRKIESELPGQSPTEPTPTPLARRDHSGARTRTVELTAVADLPHSARAATPEDRRPAVELSGANDRLDSSQTVAVGDRGVHGFHVFFEQARVILAGQPRLRQRPMFGFVFRRRLPFKIANRQGKSEPISLAAPHGDGSPPGVIEQSAAANCEPANELTETASAKILSNLVGIRWLDQLMFDAALPLSPESLGQDARTVLKWLGIGDAKAIRAEHYDQFGCAVGKYITECQDPFVRLAPATQRSPSALNDEIRAVLSRLEGQDQTTMVVDKALTWFANVWIGLFIALNFVAVIGLLIVAPTLWVGLAELVEIYSPFNVSTWIAQALALSPGLAAIVWRNRRFKLSRGAPDIVFGANAIRRPPFLAPLVTPAAGRNTRPQRPENEYPPNALSAGNLIDG